jgi:hypothetical protein
MSALAPPIPRLWNSALVHSLQTFNALALEYRNDAGGVSFVSFDEQIYHGVERTV